MTIGVAPLATYSNGKHLYHPHFVVPGVWLLSFLSSSLHSSVLFIFWNVFYSSKSVVVYRPRHAHLSFHRFYGCRKPPALPLHVFPNHTSPHPTLYHTIIIHSRPTKLKNTNCITPFISQHSCHSPFIWTTPLFRLSLEHARSRSPRSRRIT